MTTASTADRPRALRLVADQVGYATREMWRARVVFVFTFLFPLTWLVVIGFLAGNATVDGSGGLRVMQFVTPAAIAMGVLYATFPTPAIALSVARERKVLLRLRGTPLPAWVHLAGRIGGAIAFATGSALTVLVVAVLAYDVQIVWRTVPATLVTVVVAIACFAALGLAVAGLAPSAAVAQAASIAGAVVLGFLSGLFTVGELPGWAVALGGALPLRPFTEALRTQFAPGHPGAGWDLVALGILAAWGTAGAVVAALTFRWEPRPRAARAPVATPDPRPAAPRPARMTAPGRPSTARLLLDQGRWALLTIWREPGSVFFSVIVPVAVFAFTASMVPREATGPDGTPFGLSFGAGMATWGAAVAAFVTLPSAVALARERGVLGRLRGTPLPAGVHLAGQTLSALVTALLASVLVLGVGVGAFGVRISAAGIPVALALLVLGTTTLAACGLALAAALPTSKAVTAVGLGVLLPVAFFSDVFTAGSTPGWMATAGTFLPLKHLANGLTAALDPAGPSVSGTGIGVLAAWLLGAGAIAVRAHRRVPGRH